MEDNRVSYTVVNSSGKNWRLFPRQKEWSGEDGRPMGPNRVGGRKFLFWDSVISKEMAIDGGLR